ncbi:MAG: DALR anticodon-binding domain-containing protein, partial [Ahrensia sp.]
LHATLQTATADADDAASREDYEGAFGALAQLRAPIDRFFDDVMVNADDEAVRKNRLALLSSLRATTRKLADFAKISG